jgi:DNA-binding beta-propeller fold protein YncE
VLLVLLAGLLVLLMLIGWYLLFRKPINPIPLIPNAFKAPAYTSSIYGATNPLGVAVSADGSRIYVAETDGDRAFRVFDASGRALAASRPPVASTGAEHVPTWLAIDPRTADVYVSDRPTGQIYIFDRDGRYQRSVQLLQPVAGWQPMGLAFDSDGSLYVADVGGKAPRIEVIDRAGNLVRTIGDDDLLSFVNGIAVDKRGLVYAADSNNGRLLVFGTDGTILARVTRGAGGSKLALPRGVAIDDDGRVYVGDSTAQGVQVFASPSAETGRLDYLGFFGGPGVSDGAFSFPNGVATDARGRVYVADTFNNRVQVWGY